MTARRRYWTHVLLAAAFSGSVFFAYIFFSGGLCRAALEFSDSCTLATRWQALLIHWKTALLFLPVAIFVGAVAAMRIMQREKRDAEKGAP